MFIVAEGISQPLLRPAKGIRRAYKRLSPVNPVSPLVSAGESEPEMWPTMNMLRAHGIRAIIDYAAEDDVQPVAKKSSSAAGSGPSSTAATTDGAGATAAGSSSSSGSAGGAPVRYKSQKEVVGRTYDYQSEAKCDHHVDIFLNAIGTVGRLEGNGFAAIKVS